MTSTSGGDEPPPDDAVVTSLPTHTWDSREAVQYEVALEALSQHVAACTDRLEEAERQGDQARADRLVALQEHYIARRRTLRAEDHAGIREILDAARAEQRRILTTL